jgi:rhodanese-related sulfurtransferase
LANPIALLLIAAVTFFFSVDAVHAEAQILSAPDAAEQMASGNFVLLDIRSPEEWAESGVAKGAWPVSMHVEGFPERLNAIFQHYDPSQIGLICATGNRSRYVAQVLEQSGIVGVTDVSEGMFGNPTGAGWIERGLPVVSVEDAKLSYHKAQEAWSQ